MDLSELVAHVGCKNIKIQRVDASCLGARTSKDGTTVLQIETTAISVTDIFRFTEGIPLPMHGLILWMPRDKLAEVLPHKKIP